jgi:hypothetical protein
LLQGTLQSIKSIVKGASPEAIKVLKALCEKNPGLTAEDLKDLQMSTLQLIESQKQNEEDPSKGFFLSF